MNEESRVFRERGELAGGASTRARPPKYDFHVFESKWRARREEQKLYQADLHGARRPYYNLMMFPYPSAEGLHGGTIKSYIVSHIHGRSMRMQGIDVFKPIGVDAFVRTSANL